MSTAFLDGIRLTNPPRRFSQDDMFRMADYTSPLILRISRNCDIMEFSRDVQRATLLGLGCAGALPVLLRACDLVHAHPNWTAAVLAVEICSAWYFVDGTMDTVVANAICADGAAAFVIGRKPSARSGWPTILDFESHIDSWHIDEVGFDQRDGKLRIVLANSVRDLAGP